LQEIDILRKLTNAENAKVLGAMTKEKMQETQDLLVKYVGLKKRVDVSDVYTNEFLS
jgi:hypothetical protein